jgi:hypothetical protein
MHNWLEAKGRTSMAVQWRRMGKWGLARLGIGQRAGAHLFVVLDKTVRIQSFIAIEAR